MLVMVALVWQARPDAIARTATSGVLAVIAVFTVGAATWQAWTVPSTYSAHGRDIRAPRNFADIVVADPTGAEPPHRFHIKGNVEPEASAWAIDWRIHGTA